MRLILPLLAALLLVGCDYEDFGPSDRYKAEFHYTLKPTDRLSVENFNGEVEVAGWDQPSIEITGTRYAATQENLDNIKIDIHESAGLTEIRTVHPNTFHGNQGARYLIRAPRQTLVDRIVSSNGSVRVHDMTAAARIHTSNGPIRVENIKGGVDAETSNGAIELDSVTGKLNLHTSNGRIRAEELTGACEAETSNGPVTLRFKDAPDGAVHVTTSNGSVDVTMAQSPKSGIRAETSNGSITMELPGNTAARLNAQTSQSISSDFDVMDGLNSDHEKHHLEGNIGAGGPLIDLSTHNGGIRLRKSAISTN
jgi:PBP1b-binding outer membrane lipoprotein LpoB